jgi:acetolactate synthase-1/2/3 large subunit
MKLRGAEIVVRALEAEGARFTFGIPGTHNIELYDALERSAILPVLVTDEQSASFMADGVSRTTGGVGVVNVVPGAGVTHCLSGVAEAFMDGIPLVVLTCGIRSDTGKAYQLHDIDQKAILRPVTKGVLRPESPADIYPTVRRAFDLARHGTPGPVAVEIPADYYLMTHEVDGLVFTPAPPAEISFGEDELHAAAEILNRARLPVLYVGYGARDASGLLGELAQRLGSPVATTIQGKGVFPETNPLWLWNGLGASAPPFVRDATRDCDAMLAIGCRFGELATASYGFTPPSTLIHVDINRDVFNRNYPARLSIEADAADFLKALLPLIQPRQEDRPFVERMLSGHRDLREAWLTARSPDRVTPALFFDVLQRIAPRAIYTTDSGNGTFLAMEHLRLVEPGCFNGPIDFSCMGYSVPAAIGAKLGNPDRDVVALAGDGALLMTGLEMLTAGSYGVAPVVCVLRDGELAQIAQFQRTALNRDTCSVLAPYSVEAFASGVGAEFVRASNDDQVEPALERAFELARAGRPVMAEVAIDYSRKTFFTRGVVATNFWRLPLSERMRMLARAVGRRLMD